MSDTRRRIREHVEADAGIHFNELVRDSPFAPGQIQYHIRRLVDDGDVHRERFSGRTHYYPPAYDDHSWERATLALFRRETAREIIVFLLEGPARPAPLADDLGIARSTLEYHLDSLAEHAIVEKRYDDRGRVSLHLAEPERTGRLLARVRPTGPDRLVDRFTRLVDGLLEGSE